LIQRNNHVSEAVSPFTREMPSLPHHQKLKAASQLMQRRADKVSRLLLCRSVVAVAIHDTPHTLGSAAVMTRGFRDPHFHELRAFTRHQVEMALRSQAGRRRHGDLVEDRHSCLGALVLA
jgi:hypothetical protein